MQRHSYSGKEDIVDVNTFRTDLLNWYDRHRRVLPWRAEAGQVADPYHVWLSEVMLQQTVVAAVIPYFQKFVEKWPTVHNLAVANQDEVMQCWAGLGYYARARNLHKCAQVVSEEYGGFFPDDQDQLKKLPGIGDYTSAAITAIAFDKPAVVVDGNVDRVISRFFSIKTPLPDSKAEIRGKSALLADGRRDRPGDFAQAMMDLGATVCKPQSPSCILCPLQKNCAAYSEGIQEELPYKRKKVAKPQKYGRIYAVCNEKGEFLLEKRSEKGMLGGMIGFPVSDWVKNKKSLSHPDIFASLLISPLSGVVISHSFTHFHLEQYAYCINIKEGAKLHFADNMFWIDGDKLKNQGFPTVFKKFVSFLSYSNDKIS